MKDLLLGIDIGTGSTKGVICSPDGRVLETASTPHAMSLPGPGRAEMDAEQIWWRDVVAMCRDLVEAATADRVAGVCVSGLGPCLLLCDANTQPVRPAILYGIDMRATEEIADLTARFGADEILATCGKALSTQAVGPKMVWMQRHEPDRWERATRWFTASSFIAARLSGEYVIDHHTASQSDPLYDIRAGQWKDEWAEVVAPGLEMPRLVWPSEVIGTVTAEAAEQTGMSVGTPVLAGTVDAWAEAFSAGARRPGDLMLMYGSTVFFVQVLTRFRSHPMLWTTKGVEPDSYTLAAGMATSGSLTRWLRQLLGDVPYETLISEAQRVPAGSEGLVVLPYFAGERTPIFDPRARGIIAGLSLRHNRAHIFRAAYEGIAYGIRHILEFLDHDEDPPTRLVAVGGGTQGGLWTQIVSDVTGRAQMLPSETVGASYGDALLAAIGTELVPPETDWARIGREIEPTLENRDIYDELYSTFRDLYPVTRELVHDLSRLQEEAASMTVSS